MQNLEKYLPVAVVVDSISTGQFYASTLKRKGFRPVHVTSDALKKSPGLARYLDNASERLQSEYAVLIHDWTDLEDLKVRLAPLAPRCVLAGAESGVELADALAEALGLPGNDPARSAIRRDKLLMQQALAERGLPHLSSLATADLDEALAFADSLGSWPVVVKPLRSAGTEGVRLCASPLELRQAFTAVADCTSFLGECNERVLIQKCAQGREFAINCVSREGRHLLSDLWEYNKITSIDGAPVYDRVMLIRELTPEHKRLIAYTFDVLDALGIFFGPSHAEIMLTAKGPVLIECAARPMGGSFPPDLITEALGHTQLEWAVDSYVDPEAFDAHLAEPYRPKCSMCMKLLISNREGSIRSIPGIALAARLPSARKGDFTETLASGHLPRTVDLLTSSGSLWLVHADQAVVEDDCATLRELETLAENELFELDPADPSLEVPEDWFALVPDEQWLKPEDVGPGDAEVIWKALGLSGGERVLDCPCGDARVGLHLAKRGAVVTGLDINPRFIERARERFAEAGLKGDLRVCDMRQLADREAYDAIVNWFNSYGYFGVETDFDVLTRFAASLRPGGKILLEAPNRTGILGNITCKYDAEGNPIQTTCFDDVTERVVMRLPAAGPDGKSEVRIGSRMYSLQQYSLLIRLAGLKLEKVYGEGLTEFCADTCKRMIMIAVKPE